MALSKFHLLYVNRELVVLGEQIQTEIADNNLSDRDEEEALDRSHLPLINRPRVIDLPQFQDAWGEDQQSLRDESEENKVQVLHDQRPRRITLNNYEDAKSPRIEEPQNLIPQQPRRYYGMVYNYKYLDYELDADEASEYHVGLDISRNLLRQNSELLRDYRLHHSRGINNSMNLSGEQQFLNMPLPGRHAVSNLRGSRRAFE